MSEAFWTWFSGESERLFQAIDVSATAVVEEVGAVLRDHHPGVCCELPAKAEGSPQATMVLTPDGNEGLVPTVRELVATAPQLARWNFVPFRQRGKPGVTIEMHGATLSDEDDVFYRIGSGPYGELRLTLFIRGLTQAEDDPRALMAVLLMDHLIGEQDSLTVIDSLIRLPLGDEAESGLTPITSLAADIDHYKTSGLDTWDSYRTSVDDEGTVGFITVRVGLGTVAPLRALPLRVRVVVPFANPREDGFPTREEGDLLDQIEDELDAVLIGECGALSVGRVTTAGVRDLAFYAPEGEMIEAHAKRVFAGYPQYEPEVLLVPDPGWEFYLDFLLPSRFDLLARRIERDLEGLDRAGDDLDQAREITWLLLFEDRAGREAYLSALPPEFLVLDKHEEQPRAIVATTIPARTDQIGPVVHELFRRFESIAGTVGGWDCPSAKAD